MPARKASHNELEGFLNALMDLDENSEIEIHEVKCAYEDRLDIIEQRLTRIERVLSKLLR